MATLYYEFKAVLRAKNSLVFWCVKYDLPPDKGNIPCRARICLFPNI